MDFFEVMHCCCHAPNIMERIVDTATHLDTGGPMKSAAGVFIRVNSPCGQALLYADKLTVFEGEWQGVIAAILTEDIPVGIEGPDTLVHTKIAEHRERFFKVNPTGLHRLIRDAGQFNEKAGQFTLKDWLH